MRNESNGLMSQLQLRLERDRRREQGWVNAEGTQLKPHVAIAAVEPCNST